MKYIMDADVTSYKIKWSIEEKLLSTDPAEIGIEFHQAIQRVLEHQSLRDKFTGIHQDFKEKFSSIKINKEGFKFIFRE